MQVTDVQGPFAPNVVTQFETNVVKIVNSGAVNSIVPPQASEITGVRTGIEVTWSATWINRIRATYLWSFDQAGGNRLAGFPNYCNCIENVLWGYNETITGIVSLRIVENGGGTTYISFSLPEGLFPDVTHLWSRQIGSSNADLGGGIAMDNAGNVVVIGLKNLCGFGCTATPWATVNKFTPGGTPLWSESRSNVQFMGVAVDGTNNIIVGGGGDNSAFVRKLAPDGTELWEQWFNDGNDNWGISVAVDGQGNVVVNGYMGGAVDFGVVKLDAANGAHLWSRSLGGPPYGAGNAVAVDGQGNVLITGYFESTTVDFGGKLLTSAGDDDIFVVKLAAADGAHLWSRSFGGTGPDDGLGIAADGGGNVVVTGYFEGTVDFGGGALTSAGKRDIFVVKLDAAGSHLWSRRFGGLGSDDGKAVAVDGQGNVVITGDFRRTVDFGGGPLTSVHDPDPFPGPDVFLVKLAATNGAYLWSRSFGGSESARIFCSLQICPPDTAVGVAVDGAGHVVLTGHSFSTIDFGGGPLYGRDIFVAKFAVE